MGVRRTYNYNLDILYNFQVLQEHPHSYQQLLAPRKIRDPDSGMASGQNPEQIFNKSLVNPCDSLVGCPFFRHM
jgi:hypothetical protein